MDVTVIGGGYVGLVTAAGLADVRNQVRILDLDRHRTATLSAGKVPFHEPGLESVVAGAFEARRLTATTDPRLALNGTSLVLVCVGTPLLADGEADTNQVASACATIAEFAPDARVVVRSTLPLGASAELARWCAHDSWDRIATNPEFLRQGSAVQDFAHPSRLVIGTQDGSRNIAAVALLELFGNVQAPVILCDFVTAEMIKNAANAFLAAKLSFVNEVADLCEAYGADADVVLSGVGMDPRIGEAYMHPGIGFGGSCLPKELANLVRLGNRQGMPMHTMDAAGRANELRPSQIADRLEYECGPLRGRTVAMLGLTFKADTDDVRYSPALALAATLAARGVRVAAHDPMAPAEVTHGIPGVERWPTPDRAIDGCDLVILATDWPEYRDLPWSELRGRAANAVVFDGRRQLDPQAVRDAGWRIVRVGEKAS